MVTVGLQKLWPGAQLQEKGVTVVIVSSENEVDLTAGQMQNSGPTGEVRENG